MSLIELGYSETAREEVVTKAPEKATSAVQSQIAAADEIDASQPERGVAANAPPVHGWRTDYRELVTTQRARRQGLALMAASSIFMIVLFLAGWLLLRTIF